MFKFILWIYKYGLTAWKVDPKCVCSQFQRRDALSFMAPSYMRKVISSWKLFRSVSKHEIKVKNVCGNRTQNAFLTNKNFTFTLQQTHAVYVLGTESPYLCTVTKARRCHVAKILKCFTQHRSVEWNFATGHFRRNVSGGNFLENLRREFIYITFFPRMLCSHKYSLNLCTCIFLSFFCHWHSVVCNM
jgi:hypothetical protein